jgi:large subunit ribosomal protein L29
MKSKVQAKDLRGNETAELERTLAKLREDLFQQRLKHNTNQIENTMVIRSTRRDIARMSTVLAEKSRSAAAAVAKEK